VGSKEISKKNGNLGRFYQLLSPGGWDGERRRDRKKEALQKKNQC